MGSDAIKQSKQTIHDFVTTLYKRTRGKVYVATLDSRTGTFVQAFFEWPAQKNDVVKYLWSNSLNQVNVHMAPALLKENATTAQEKDVLGSHFLWCEFDRGRAAQALARLPEGLPEPSIRLQSSTAGNEHWYWQLDSFCNNTVLLKAITKGLAYSFVDSEGNRLADLSVQDINQLLRPPAVRNWKPEHAGKRITTKILEKHSDRVYNIDQFADFASLAPSKDVEVKLALEELPSWDNMLTRVLPDNDAREIWERPKGFFAEKHAEKEARGEDSEGFSGAMWKFINCCLEGGLSVADTTAFAWELNKRHGFKYATFDRFKKQEIEKAVLHQQTKPKIGPDEDEEDKIKFISMRDFRTRDKLPVNWIFKDLIAEKTYTLITGGSGIGKSSVAVSIAKAMVFGTKFGIWDYASNRDLKIGYLSLDNDEDDIDDFEDSIESQLTDEQKEKWYDHFFLFPQGTSEDMAREEKQAELVETLEENDINVLIIDTMEAAGVLKETAETVREFIKGTLKKRLELTIIGIHHNRKSQSGESTKPQSLDDVYGSRYITADAHVVIGLWENRTNLHFICLKNRRRAKFREFISKRKDGLNFEFERWNDSASLEETPASNAFESRVRAHISGGNNNAVSGRENGPTGSFS